MPKKLTHEEFLERLHESNEYYRQDCFKIISKYENYNTKIKVEDKYGICITSYEMLVRGNYKPSVLSAADKHSYFLAEVRANNLGCKEGEFEIISEYKGRLHKVEILDKYNCKHSIYASSLIKGAQPCIDTAISKENYFLEKLKVENPKMYNYIELVDKLTPAPSKTLFKTKYGLIEVIYTEFFRKDYTNISIRSAVDKTDFWTKRAKDIAPNKGITDYSDVIYINNNTKIKLKYIAITIPKDPLIICQGYKDVHTV